MYVKVIWACIFDNVYSFFNNLYYIPMKIGENRQYIIKHTSYCGSFFITTFHLYEVVTVLVDMTVFILGERVCNRS